MPTPQKGGGRWSRRVVRGRQVTGSVSAMSRLTFAEDTILHPLVAAAVERHGIVTRIIACDPALADTAAFCEAYEVEPDDSANTIVVIGKGTDPAPLAACLVLATMRLDVNGSVRRRFGTKKASFASQDLACAHTGMEFGGVTVVGLPDGMALWIDVAVMTRSEIVVGGGNRISKLLLVPAEFLKLPGAEIVEGLAVAPSSSA